MILSCAFDFMVKMKQGRIQCYDIVGSRRLAAFFAFKFPV